MSAYDYYRTQSSSKNYNPYRQPANGPPVLPPLPYQSSSSRQDLPPLPYESSSSRQDLPPLPYETSNSRQNLLRHDTNESPSPFDSPYATSPTPLQPSQDEARYYDRGHSAMSITPDDGSSYFTGQGYRKDPQRQYSDEIPLREHPQSPETDPKRTSPEQMTQESDGLPQPAAANRQRRQRREPSPEPPKKFFSRDNTWVVFFFTFVQLSVFIAELVRNAVLTSSPIEIHPQVNPMLGPSFPVLVNMGARYVPCMKNVPDLAPNLNWPCPNMTTSDPTDPSNMCNIDELCGFQNFGDSPNQWWRFIVPMFLHAGFVHIGFNMLLQLTLGRDIERIIGSIRFLVVYIASGIFGFVLGGNFAAPGIASTGASGALFGMIAINLLDLLYTWHGRRSPKTELAFIMLDIAISFVLGLLPGLDNFSHIGGFLMGLVLGICILHSPNLLRLEKKQPDQAEDPTKKRKRRRAKRVSYKQFTKDPAAFFKGRKALWWAWWFVRAGALIGVLVAFIVLINTFYLNNTECQWCRYLSCINVNNWCNLGQLPTANGGTTTNGSS